MNIMYKHISLVISVVLLIGCAKVSRENYPTVEHSISNAQKFDLETEEYSVYSVLIDEMYIHNGTQSVVIVSNTTLGPGDLDKTIQVVKDYLPGGISQEVINDFRAKNNLSYSLSNEFRSRVKYVLLGKEELDQVFHKGGGWEEFLARYPGQSIIKFSRVGFNRDMSQALVYSSTQSGMKSGEGYYVMLVKENDSWTIKHKVDVWVS